LPPQGASCTLQFTLSAAAAVPFTIPAGTLIGTQDGVYAFATQSDVTFLVGQIVATTFAVCTTPGKAANGYAVGQVSIQLNPNRLISGVTNTTVTSGGGDIETDDHLRARIQQAPNRFSVAGPTGAYRFWALSADPSIIDVSITTQVPGVQTCALPISLFGCRPGDGDGGGERSSAAISAEPGGQDSKGYCARGVHCRDWERAGSLSGGAKQPKLSATDGGAVGELHGDYFDASGGHGAFVSFEPLPLAPSPFRRGGNQSRAISLFLFPSPRRGEGLGMGVSLG